VFVATLLCALDAALHAQVFDVATVKLTPANQVGPIQPSIVQFLPNGFRRTNSTLRSLVRTAYDVQDQGTGVRTGQTDSDTAVAYRGLPGVS
jgi:hypothetical protein